MIAVLAGLALGDAGLGILDLPLSDGGLHPLAELTLVFVLFEDETRIDLTELPRQAGLPVRLLGIGLPVAMLLGRRQASCWSPS